MTTQYLQFQGKVKWVRAFVPDEFRGAVRWSLDFYPKDEAELKKLQTVLNANKKVKENEDGKFISFYRPTTKLIKGNIVNFTPPVIYGKDGEILVKYVHPETGKDLRSYEDKDLKPNRVGDLISIGNGSEVEITLCVYPTSMGNGNRLETIKILDLIEYVRPEESEDAEADTSVGDEDKPW